MDLTDRFIAYWQSRKDEWRHTCQEIRTSRDQWKVENQNRKFYIRFLVDRFREATQEASEAQEIVDKAKRFIGMTSPFEGHRAQLVSFLEQARSQYGKMYDFIRQTMPSWTTFESLKINENFLLLKMSCANAFHFSFMYHKLYIITSSHSYNNIQS